MRTYTKYSCWTARAALPLCVAVLCWPVWLLRSQGKTVAHMGHHFSRNALKALEVVQLLPSCRWGMALLTSLHQKLACEHSQLMHTTTTTTTTSNNN